MKSKTLLNFSLSDLLAIAIIASLGTAVKIVSGILIRSLTGSIGIPGGAVAGGFYMMWLALGMGVVRKKGTPTLIALIQAIMVFSGGLPGSHGILTFLTYLLPGLMVECVFLASKDGNFNILHFVIATMIANIMGTIGTNLIFFRLPLLPLLFTLISAAFSGALGGVLAFLVYKNLNISKEKSLKLKEIKSRLLEKSNYDNDLYPKKEKTEL